jgi:parallel beta-helix repeat protein
MLFLLVLIVVTVGGVGEERFPHAPISILSDADFTMANGVVTGHGTPTDPYVIANWTIDAGTGVGIRIQETSAYVLIRNCHIIGDSRRSTGVLLREAAHVRVHRCGAREHGIFLWRCHEASLRGNALSDCSNGIYLDSCHRDNLDGNRVERMDHGIFLWDCFDCTVVGNVLHACDLGLALVHTSARNTEPATKQITAGTVATQSAAISGGMRVSWTSVPGLIRINPAQTG